LPAASPSPGRQAAVVYATGVVQGIVLVTFPAASAIFTAKDQYGLSSTLYGIMFLPQVAGAIAAALAGGRLSRRFGTKRIYQAGLIAGLVAMVILFGSQFVESNEAVAYPLLLVATAFVGVGFGLTVPTLNTLTAAFHAKAVDRSTLILNALLGVGTALAPVFVAVFVGLGFWWGLPLLSVLVLAVLLAISLPLPLAAASARRAAKAVGLPARFWLLAALALLYGVVETMSGNWAGSLVVHTAAGSAVAASIALTAFWASVTVGRLLFAALQRRIPSRWIYRLIPLLVAVAYVACAVLARGSVVLAILEFALAGLGCSALLPLTISFGEEQFPDGATSGKLIATYQVGYGIAAFGVGPLLAGGVTLGWIFAAAAVVAVAISILAFCSTGRMASARAAA
jgi:MFS family permease